MALANLLNDYRQDVVSRQNYFDLLKIYARSQHRKGEGGEVVPWIDEDLDPDTGDWIARRILQQREDANKERGHDYNHSAFADVVITGLVGLRPRADDLVDVNPLLPAGTWTYFCLDHIRYHGHDLTVLWDETGKHYGKGAGLRLFDGGHEIAHSGTLGRLQGKLEFRNANR